MKRLANMSFKGVPFMMWVTKLRCEGAIVSSGRRSMVVPTSVASWPTAEK